MTGRPRPGVVLPAVLAVLLALALLSALAVADAHQELRVAGFAEAAMRARGAALHALAHAHSPPDVAALCVSGAGSSQERAVTLPSDGAAPRTAHLLWRSLGNGMVRVEAEGAAGAGARHRLIALFVPDSAERSGGLLRCPSATRLVPIPGPWVEGHPEG